MQSETSCQEDLRELGVSVGQPGGDSGDEIQGRSVWRRIERARHDSLAHETSP